VGLGYYTIRTATPPSTGPPSPSHHCRPRSPIPGRAAEPPSSTPSTGSTVHREHPVRAS
jgi:hypothetical protein